MRLGTGQYRARFHTRGGARVYWQPAEVASLRWSRVVDDTSTATLVMPKPSRGSTDWALAGAVTDWAHELSLYRTSHRSRTGPATTELVWQGPVVDVAESRTQLTFDAHDVVAYLDRMPVAVDRVQNAGVVTAGNLIAGDALAAAANANPGIVLTRSVLSGPQVWIDLRPDSTTVGAYLRELARSGLDFFAIGRRVMLQVEPAAAAGPRLTEAHFSADLEVRRAGSDTVTRAIVLGEGVTGYAGAADPYRGMLAKVVKADGTLTPAAATTAAQQLVAGARPPLMVVKVPDDAQLQPDAPVSMAYLVPGARIDVAVGGYVLPAAMTLRLTRLSVDYAAGKETVAVSLAPKTTDEEG